MSYTLVVVDMQPSFSAKEDMDVTQNIRKEIVSAINNKAHIVFVEFSYSGPTLSCLVELPHSIDYKNVHVIEKGRNDGSSEIHALVTAKDLPSNHFKVTGINTDYCVHATVDGLSYLYPKAKIEVISHACASLWAGNGQHPKNHERGIEKMRGISNVSITERFPAIYMIPSE